MPVSLRVSELVSIQQSELTDSDLLLITDAEARASKKLTLATLKQNIFSGQSVAAFDDVDITSNPPVDGQFLQWSSAQNQFVPGDISLSNVGELADVDLSIAPTNGQTLIWNAADNAFQPGTIDLGPLYSLAGATSGSINLGLFTGSIDLDGLSIKQAIQTLSNAITSKTSVNETAIATLQQDVNQNETDADASIAAMQTTIDNLEVDIAPETLNSINELAQALQDDPNIITTLSGTLNTLQSTLNKLVPPAPTTLAGLPVNVLTNAGTRKLCVGFTDRTGGTSGYVAGDSIKRNTDGTISTDKIEDVGPGDSGEVSAKISSATYDVSTTLTSDINSISALGLEISDNKDASLSTRDSGIQADFYQVYDIRLVNAGLSNEIEGLHEVSFSHAGNTTAKGYFYEDSSTPGAPVVTASSIIAPVSPTLSYSSGIAHYTNSSDNTFTYSVFISNATGDMYINNNMVTTGQTTGFTNPGNITYTSVGGTNPPAKNFLVGGSPAVHSTGQYPRDIHSTISADNQKFSNFSMSTPYGSDSVRPTTAYAVNIMGGTSRTNVMDEDNILVNNLGTGSGNAFRVSDDVGDNPVPLYGTWDPSSQPSDHEAIIRGGILRHDRTDYSTASWVPPSLDLSGRNVDPQYFEVEFRRSDVSQFTITYNGSVSGCWVCMPENTAWTTSLSGTNGWADMFQAYKGSGIPTTAEPGCSSGGLMDNNGGTFTCVFGTESSSNDLNNRVLVRWKLTSGQQINSMSFS